MIYELSEYYYVRPLREDDIEGQYPLWFQDQEVNLHNSHGKFFKTKSYFVDYQKSLNAENKIVWAICHKEDGHIGNISLQQISLINRTAEFAIILGDKKHWGKGLGLLAGNKLLEHGFQKLNLERVYCGTSETNKGMQKLALGLGMIHEGTRRSHLYLEGRRVDMFEYGVMKSEFKRLPAQ
jgi:ribosomal-protein-alanine N-acetyltransferase